MTQILSELNESLRHSLRQFSRDQGSSTELIKSQLLSVKMESQEEITQLNVFLQREIRTLLTEIMGNGKLNKVSQLISLLCDVSIQQKYGQNYSNKPSIKQSLAIIIVEDVLECLGINDLKQILPIISEKICAFKQLDVSDQNRMLRIINHLLKRISKTQDYLIRGQLQFTLTKILPICHDSGFHYRIPIAKGIQIAQTEQAEEYKDIFSSDGITYQFYKDFWELQRYLMDPNQLSSEGLSKTGNQQTSKKATQIYKTEPLISLRLRHMQKVLNEVISYMKQHSCGQSSISLLNQPIKFLTNTHLLQFQLSDEYFRRIILIQVLLFTFTLTHLKPTGSILKGIMLTESQRQTINRIDVITQKYLESLQKMKELQNKQGEQSQNLEPSIFETMKHFFANQLEWLQLKDHWKQKKKVFLRAEPITIEAEQKQKKSNQTVDYNKKIAEVHEKIAKQMNINGSTLLGFLTEPCVPHIMTTPTQTSFAYYWSQTKTCLQSFDYQNNQQHQFQTKSEYNIFQWKALRSLYKQSIKQLCLSQKNPKLREFKALAYLQKKEKEFKDQQAKLNPQNSTPSEPKSNNLFVIQQVSQIKEISTNKNQIQNGSHKQTDSNLNQIDSQIDQESPSKKQKVE